MTERKGIWLDEEGAEAVLVLIDERGELNIGQNVFTKSEARQLRDFLNENFKD